MNATFTTARTAAARTKTSPATATAAADISIGVVDSDGTGQCDGRSTCRSVGEGGRSLIKLAPLAPLAHDEAVVDQGKPTGEGTAHVEGGDRGVVGPDVDARRDRHLYGRRPIPTLPE